MGLATSSAGSAPPNPMPASRADPGGSPGLSPASLSPSGRKGEDGQYGIFSGATRIAEIDLRA